MFNKLSAQFLNFFYQNHAQNIFQSKWFMLNI